MSDYTTMIERFRTELLAIAEDQASANSAPDRWSPKEILGHLIDSAVNNHRRIVLAQLKDDLVFDGYDQEGWVSVQGYNECSWSDLIEFWYAYNRRLLDVISRIPSEKLNASRTEHSLNRIAMKRVPADQPATLAYLIQDYFDHMVRHMGQIKQG